MTVLLRFAMTGLLLAALVGCDARTERASPASTAAPPATTQAPEPAPSSVAAPGETLDEEHVVRAYFVREEQVGPVTRFVVGPVARQVTGEGVAAGAMVGLLAGPTPDEQRLGLFNEIPEGTVVHGVTVADGIATVDLSSQFASGGGTASMTSRVAQVVFTLTQFPTVDAVRFWLDGEPLDLLGGEGLILEEPQTRTDHEGLSPAILVESPLPYAAVTSPLRLTGTANTFEATFQVRVTGPDGRVVYDEFATATSGTGTRGTFDVTASYEPAPPGTGELTVYELSAEDGSEIHVATIPVEMP